MSRINQITLYLFVTIISTTAGAIDENPCLAKLMGVREAELIPYKLITVVPKDLRTNMKKHLDQAIFRHAIVVVKIRDIPVVVITALNDLPVIESKIKKFVSIVELRENLIRFVDHAYLYHQSFIITRNNFPVAVLSRFPRDPPSQLEEIEIKQLRAQWGKVYELVKYKNYRWLVMRSGRPWARIERLETGLELEISKSDLVFRPSDFLKRISEAIPESKCLKIRIFLSDNNGKPFAQVHPL
jgi:hypothetical protein